MKRYLLYICACAMVLSATAQNLTGSYFMNGMMQRTDLNPALQPDLGYITLPGLGGLGLNVRGNIGVGDLIMQNPHNPSGRIVTFMHPDVSINDLTFKKNNRLLQDMRLPLLGVGFRGMGGYNTISFALRETAGITMPGEMFSLLKNLQNRNYNIGTVGVRAMAWGELGIGHSHSIGDNLRVGAKMKILLGAARMDAALKNLTLDLSSPNQWLVTADAQVDMSVKGFGWGDPKINKYQHSNAQGVRDTYETIDFDNIDVDGAGLNGAGVAFDLGMEYDLSHVVKGLTVSAALTDLGFINWKETARARNMSQSFTFSGFQDVRVKKNEADPTLESQSQQLADDFAELYALQDAGQAKVSSGLGATLNIGAEYKLPSYERLKFGLLSTTRINGKYSWNEERVSVNYCPVNCLELGVSGAVGTFGPSFGWVLNFKPKGFNLFVGMDHMLGKMAKPCVPLKSNADVYMGLNFTFGKRKPNYKKD